MLSTRVVRSMLVARVDTITAATLLAAGLARSANRLSLGISLVAIHSIGNRRQQGKWGFSVCCPQGVRQLIDRGYLLGPRCTRWFILKISLNQ